MKHNKKCCECDNIIWSVSTYCKSCAQKGKRNSSYINGTTCNKFYCMCGNEKDYRARFCRFCHYEYNRGKNHSSWLGGISLLPYSFEFTNKLKDNIRKRDSYKCQHCHKSQKKELIQIKRKLDIHHIDYNKQNCEKNNLITLCNGCNVKANYNRDYWYAYFTYLMENK